MDNCEIDLDDTTVIIAVSGGKVSMINTDNMLNKDHSQHELNYHKVKPVAEIDSRNFCGWDGNCRIGEPDITDVEFDVNSLKM